MLESIAEVLRTGDERGNGMLLRFRFPSGLTVYALPTPNEYGGEWDLGPTWNYLVEADRPFLVDAGRWGAGGMLVEALRQLSRPATEIDYVLLSHGHEDHDGGLAEVTGRTGAAVKAHRVYDLLARKYPDLAPQDHKREFPAKCWHCFMPESFYAPNCLVYHGESQARRVQAIGDGRQPLAAGLETLHAPGHSPDALAVLAGGEVLLVGDNLLPGITPWPTSLRMHRLTAGVLGGLYPEAETLYGLKRYLRSLKELKALAAEHPDLAVLPAHRLFHGGRLQVMDLAGRVDELLRHHLDRCADILAILVAGPQDAEGIARRHFAPEKLKGPGMMMATNEAVCHCELLLEAGAAARSGKQYLATGAGDLEAFIAAI
ncbi:MAG: MBL fold metallo-hydrolase [Thermodesulfobacteriota bacterium]